MNNVCYNPYISFQNTMYGGYPQGYPPANYQSNMQQPMYPQNNAYQFQQPQPYYPGMVSTPQFEDANGNVVSNAASDVYNQGGSYINQGGFNPATRRNQYAYGDTGYNLLHDNPVPPTSNNPYYYPNNGQYNQPVNYNYNYTPNPYLNRQINAQYQSQYMTPYGYSTGYPMSDFDHYLDQILYDSKPDLSDSSSSFIVSTLLSDEEQAKIARKNQAQASYIVGTDYYGNPIYGNPYYDNLTKQKQFEDARRHYQEFNTMLSKIAHHYFGEEIDEAKAMEFYDPVRIANQNAPKPKYDLSTEAGRKEYNRELLVENTARICDTIDRYNSQDFQNYLNNIRNYGFAKIKESHDRALGVEPGQHYDLKTYLDNGHNLVFNMRMEESKKSRRDASSKFNKNAYNTALSYRSGQPIPVVPSSKDDQFISTESLMKDIYTRNKAKSYELDSNGNYTSPAAKPGEVTAVHFGSGNPKAYDSSGKEVDFKNLIRDVYNASKHLDTDEGVDDFLAKIDKAKEANDKLREQYMTYQDPNKARFMEAVKVKQENINIKKAMADRAKK